MQCANAGARDNPAAIELWARGQKPGDLLKIRNSCAHPARVDLRIGYGRRAKKIVEDRNPLICTRSKVDAL